MMRCPNTNPVKIKFVEFKDQKKDLPSMQVPAVSYLISQSSEKPSVPKDCSIRRSGRLPPSKPQMDQQPPGQEAEHE